MKKRTVEQKTSIKTGVGRLLFVVVALLVELGWLLVAAYRIRAFFPFAPLIFRLLAVALALGIFSRYRTPSLKMPWIILILCLPIPGIVLYLLIGLSGSTRKMKKRYEEIDNILFPAMCQDQQVFQRLLEKDKGVANIARYINDCAKFPIYQNTDVEFYPEAIQGLEAQKESLRQAKKFIFMEYHAIEDEESFAGIREILAEKAAAGVEVRLFYDDMGSLGFISNREFMDKMESMGIHCRVFNPMMPLLNVFLNNRDHRKITVIDGVVGYTGGYNLANEYFNITHPYGYWKDTGVKITGDAVRNLTIMFLEMWNAVKGNDVNDASYDYFLEPVDYQAQGQGFVQPYGDSPLDYEQTGENVYMSIVENAKDYVYFMTPYLIITDEMNHILGLAAKRGVDVRIITPGIPDKKVVYAATRSYYSNLVRHGVRIFEYTPGFCHGKQCVSDDVVATCGTINLDYRSLYHHFENGCLLYNCKVVPDIKKDFDETLAQCREVTEEYRTGRTTSRRFHHLLLRLLAPML